MHMIKTRLRGTLALFLLSSKTGVNMFSFQGQRGLISCWDGVRAKRKKGKEYLANEIPPQHNNCFTTEESTSVRVEADVDVPTTIVASVSLGQGSKKSASPILICLPYLLFLQKRPFPFESNKVATPASMYKRGI